MAQLTFVMFKQCLPFQLINLYQLHVPDIIFISFLFYHFSLILLYVLAWSAMCYWTPDELLTVVRFGFDIFIFTNLSTAARKRQGWYQRLLVNGRVESLFLILVSFVCNPGLPAMCLLTQVLYIVCAMLTSNLDLVNFNSNFCSSHPTT